MDNKLSIKDELTEFLLYTAPNGKVKVEHFGRFGGMIPAPDEVLHALEEKFLQ